MGIYRIKVTSKLSPNASREEKRKNLEKMLRNLRSAFNEPGGLKDKLERHEYFVKPSEVNRMRRRKERASALFKLKNGENK